MFDISKKSVGVLIDELITTNIKCYMAQEVIMKESDNDKVIIASRSAQELNRRRNLLINAIDKKIGLDIFSPSNKTY